jgi:hypothetical protein
VNSIAGGNLLRLQQQPAIAERRHAREFRALVLGCSEWMGRNPDEPTGRLDHSLGHCRDQPRMFPLTDDEKRRLLTMYPPQWKPQSR